MKLQDLHSDLEYLYQSLFRHPMLIEDVAEKEDFSELYPMIKERCVDWDSFISAATDLTSFFCDGHTNIELPYGTGDLCLPIPCHWKGDELITDGPFEELPAGTNVLGLEGTPILHILQRMCRRIPHENIHLVKSRLVGYPYRNYHLFSQLNLTWLFGPKDSYRVDFLNGDHVISKEIPLTAYSGFLDFPNDDAFVSWSIHGNAALLRLDACICNETYEHALHELAVQCAAQNVTSLTLDLSRNMGGSSAVIDKFLEYVNTASYHRYEMIDYASMPPVIRCARNESVINNKSAHCFPSQLYCIVSQDTFSSARTFAVTLKDNGLAKIIGTPTGGKPSSYGLPKRDTLPNSKICFRVSQALFLRPDPSLDDEDTLTPDIWI